jgi:ferritin-like metal-binding protein YciE
MAGCAGTEGVTPRATSDSGAEGDTTEMAEDTREKLIRYLNDSHATETGGIVALKDIAHRAEDPEVKRVAEELSHVAESQAARIAGRITELGGTLATGKALFTGTLATGNRLTNAFHDINDKQTQDVGKAYGLSAFEEAMYTALLEYSRAIGDEATAFLAEELIAEERDACRKLLAQIPRIAVLPAYEAPRPDWNEEKTGGKKMAGLTVPVLLIGGAALAAWGLPRLFGSTAQRKHAEDMQHSGLPAVHPSMPSLQTSHGGDARGAEYLPTGTMTGDSRSYLDEVDDDLNGADEADLTPGRPGTYAQS